jgi:hypothetical protein
MKRTSLTCIAIAFLASASHRSTLAATTFGDDLKFLRDHGSVVVLSDKSGQAQVIVVPGWQAHVMTSTAKGPAGVSFGWVNRDLIASGKPTPHMNALGGEDRFWLGPEGGQFSIFFAKGVPFDLEHWFTPPAIDTEPFQVISQESDRVVCGRSIQLENYSGTKLSLDVRREVRLVGAAESLAKMHVNLPADVNVVAFESVNSIKNTGSQAWRKDTGLLSIWILGMFNASDQSTVVVPFEKGPESARGPIVNDTYFGKVPADRLVVKDGVLFFKADANYRSKIGLSPRRAKPLLASYDAANHALTLVQFTLPAGVTDYVNSMWKIQDDPFSGDAANSYNDGPAQPGQKQMGRFYEVESSSPALSLAPGQSAEHVHRTLHLQGSDKSLDAVARATLGVSLDEIKTAFAK